MPVNPKKYIDKLIQALEGEGKYYNYYYKRFYSNKVERYVTKYIIESKDDKNTKIEVYNKIEILKYLVREWRKVKGEPVDEEYTEPFDDEKK